MINFRVFRVEDEITIQAEQLGGNNDGEVASFAIPKHEVAKLVAALEEISR